MEGNGLAPIGHIAHIQAVTGTTINITSTITYESGYTFADLKSQLELAIDNYFKSLSESWENSTQLVARISQIESAILNVPGIQDIDERIYC